MRAVLRNRICSGVDPFAALQVDANGSGDVDFEEFYTLTRCVFQEMADRLQESPMRVSEVDVVVADGSQIRALLAQDEVHALLYFPLCHGPMQSCPPPPRGGGGSQPLGEYAWHT